MTTIRIRPPMTEVPKGEHCNPFNGKSCTFVDAIVSTWWCLFEGCENPLEWDSDAKAHLKRPFCVAACAEAEKMQRWMMEK